MKKSKRFLAPGDLRGKGITFCPSYLRRLIHEDKFPRPVKLSPRKLAWPEEVIDAWLSDKLKAE